MEDFIYEGEYLKEISFPIGGIGSGCIGLAGNGRLIDFEIFNRPNKGSHNGFTHFAVKAEDDANVLDARVMQGDYQGNLTGDFQERRLYRGYGFGPERGTMAGFPHFEKLRFTGTFPIAKIDYEDRHFPGKVSLEAFNPFIPSNSADSSLPAAFFELSAQNTTDSKKNYTFSLSFSNPIMNGLNRPHRLDVGQAVVFCPENDSLRGTPDEGEICAATDSANSALQTYWYKGNWFDSLGIFWREFTKYGTLTDRTYPRGTRSNPDSPDTATLTAALSINPGETGSARFVIAWYFPNCVNYWNPEAVEKQKTWKNYYATVFNDSNDVTAYCLSNWQRLYDDTKLFRDTLFKSTLPAEILDAVSANISILKSPTCLRLENGEFYGFEGCHANEGSCEGSCTHVWNYAYALPFLFPDLERSMRELDYRYNQREDGGMSFRLQLPLGREPWAHRPCADGQFGGIIKAYRDFKICGDISWLKSVWPNIRKSLEFAWSSTNEDHWDADRDGVLEGRQHHTLDMELFGPNSWLSGFYLAALKACSEMAAILDDKELSDEYKRLFDSGREWVNSNLFNGHFYTQIIDIHDKSIMERYNQDGTAVSSYWDDERREIKYQICGGCGIDQVVAQWHANICGLGSVFDPIKVRKSLESIYTYNFRLSMRETANPCRLFALNDEGGAVICEWPDETDGLKNKKPSIPLTYAEETMCGFEYQAAAHMIQEGMPDKGLDLVRAVRARFNGKNRNPWNEFECGSNYARSMSSYSLLLAISGFTFDLYGNSMGFNPCLVADEFRCFWCLEGAWGEVQYSPESFEIKVLYGDIELSQVSYGNQKTVHRLMIDNENVFFNACLMGIKFAKRVVKHNSLIIYGDS